MDLGAGRLADDEEFRGASHPQYGARPLKRVLQREVLNELSKQILAGKVHKDSVIFVDVDDEQNFVFENAESAEVLNS